MPQNAVVIVRYGPYKSCGIVDHRTFRLIGLQGRYNPWLHSNKCAYCSVIKCVLVLYKGAVSSLPLSFPDNVTYLCLLTFLAALKENGHQSVLEKMSDWNKVELVVNGECVYTCSIKQLEFGGDGKLDPLCKEAVTAVQNAY
uniref:Chromosome 10 open reading frame 53 n=1 Tax=Oncorhynchus kisutch TaxID=8019 RepID=A0A8C7L279_ONCKI